MENTEAQSSVSLTLREAAFVFGDSLKSIIRSVEEHPELAIKTARGEKARRLRSLEMPDLIYLQALGEMGELLTPQGRRELHTALRVGARDQEVFVGCFKIRVDRLRDQVKKRLEALDALKGAVSGCPDDPLIKGTAIEVYRVSALLEAHATVDEVARDYPSLAPEQIELARAYAQALPKKGRPYPKISFKNAVRRLNLQSLSDANEQEDHA